MAKRTSENDSLQFFALDTPILSSVRPKMIKHGSERSAPKGLRRKVRAEGPHRGIFRLVIC